MSIFCLLAPNAGIKPWRDFHTVGFVGKKAKLTDVSGNSNFCFRCIMLFTKSKHWLISTLNKNIASKKTKLQVQKRAASRPCLLFILPYLHNCATQTSNLSSCVRENTPAAQTCGRQVKSRRCLGGAAACIPCNQVTTTFFILSALLVHVMSPH